MAHPCAFRSFLAEEGLWFLLLLPFLFFLGSIGKSGKREYTGKLVLALDGMRRLPREKAEQNVADVLTLNPTITEDVLATVDLPSGVSFDNTAQKPFLMCDYSRDGDSYRFLLSRWIAYTPLMFLILFDS